MGNNHTFLPNRGNYKKLIAYQKAECIYDITYHFAHRFLERGDRTIDQMVQAARSGKQNIAEGSTAATTSIESEIKLFNVAKASLQELLVDFEDYLRVRGKQLWDKDDERAIRTKRLCSEHSNSDYYREALPSRSDETIANIAITLIHQTDFLLQKLIERTQNDFLTNEGIREQMHNARVNARKKQ